MASRLFQVAAIAALTSAAASAAIPPAKLALMPLPLAAYGADAARLTFAPDESGAVDNKRAAATSIDRSDSAASLGAAGRIAGVDLTFANYDLIGKPGKLAYVTSTVESYRDPDAASGGLVRSLGDVTTSDPAGGLRVLSSKRFAVPGLGDEATGIQVRLMLGPAATWFTGVAVRRGELLELVGVLRTDGRSQKAAAIGLAQALSRRVEGVLAGKITSAPAKLPSGG